MKWSTTPWDLNESRNEIEMSVFLCFWSFLSVWKHIFWNELCIDQCALHCNGNTLCCRLVIAWTVFGLIAIVCWPWNFIRIFLDKDSDWIWRKTNTYWANPDQILRDRWLQRWIQSWRYHEDRVVQTAWKLCTLVVVHQKGDKGFW